MNFEQLKDDDPRANTILKRIREIWDNAPAAAMMDGQRVRMPGYVVPIEESSAGVRELLLVPHFGACIHTPPPPANQIIHVRLRQPARTLGVMDAVWISGVLKIERSDTHLGVSSYAMEGIRVEPYTRSKP